MSHYQYQGDNLLCEDLGIESITNEIETPFYCYSLRSLKDNINKCEECKHVDHVILNGICCEKSLKIN